MWGIYQDYAQAILEAGLSDAVIEFEIKDSQTAVTVQPVPDMEIAMQNIRILNTPPRFRYGDAVSPVSQPERKGIISAIGWHFKEQAYLYHIAVGGKKVSRRYFENELVKRS